MSKSVIKTSRSHVVCLEHCMLWPQHLSDIFSLRSTKLVKINFANFSKQTALVTKNINFHLPTTLPSLARNKPIKTALPKFTKLVPPSRINLFTFKQPAVSFLAQLMIIPIIVIFDAKSHRTMKYLILIALIAGFTSCKKEPKSFAKSTSSSYYNPQWIPNWYSGDTLVGYDSDTSTGQFVGIDTMYTLTIGDTSCIVYNGVKYYVWGSDYYNQIIDVVDTFKPGEKLYPRSYIGAVPFDTASCIDHGNMTAIYPHKYLMADGVTWKHTEQLIMVHDYVNFAPVFLNQYRSSKTY